MISVLYVENETAFLEIGKFFLEKDGSMEVDTCLSIFDALKKTSAKHYDIIISEYAIPVMNGIEFLKSLRSRGDTTPFIIFTGRGRTAVKMEALNQGVDFYLEKAGNAKVHFTEIIREIKRAVERKSSSRIGEQSNLMVKSTPETAVSDEKITLLQKKVPDNSVIYGGTERREGIANYELFSEPITSRKGQSGQASCLTVPAIVPMREQDALSLMWEVDAAPTLPDFKEIQFSHDHDNPSFIWELDDLIEPGKKVNNSRKYQWFFSNRKFSGACFKIGIGITILIIMTALGLKAFIS